MIAAILVVLAGLFGLAVGLCRAASMPVPTPDGLEAL